MEPTPEENAVEPEDSYLKNYRKLPKKRYSSARGRYSSVGRSWSWARKM